MYFVKNGTVIGVCVNFQGAPVMTIINGAEKGVTGPNGEPVMYNSGLGVFVPAKYVADLAELGPLAEGRIPDPLPVPSSRDWWEYEFKVRSQGVSLNDALVIIMQSPDGKMIARLSARLGSKS